MIRLAIPLIVLTLVLWAVIYGIPKAARRKSMSATKGFVVAFGLAALMLGAASALFYFGELINAH